MVADHHVERARVLQRPAHHETVPERDAIVGEEVDARLGTRQLPHRAELDAAEPPRDRRDRQQVDEPDLVPAAHDELDDDGRVRDGIGVGHRRDSGVAAGGGRGGSGRDVLRTLTAGFAQVRVQVDEAGRDPAVRRVEHVRAGGAARDVRTDGDDHAVAHEHTGDRVGAGARIEDAPSGD